MNKPRNGEKYGLYQPPSSSSDNGFFYIHYPSAPPVVPATSKTIANGLQDHSTGTFSLEFPQANYDGKFTTGVVAGEEQKHTFIFVYDAINKRFTVREMKRHATVHIVEKTSTPMTDDQTVAKNPSPSSSRTPAGSDQPATNTTQTQGNGIDLAMGKRPRSLSSTDGTLSQEPVTKTPKLSTVQKRPSIQIATSTDNLQIADVLPTTKNARKRSATPKKTTKTTTPPSSQSSSSSSSSSSSGPPAKTSPSNSHPPATKNEAISLVPPLMAPPTLQPTTTTTTTATTKTTTTTLSTKTANVATTSPPKEKVVGPSNPADFAAVFTSAPTNTPQTEIKPAQLTTSAKQESGSESESDSDSDSSDSDSSDSDSSSGESDSSSGSDSSGSDSDSSSGSGSDSDSSSDSSDSD